MPATRYLAPGKFFDPGGERQVSKSSLIYYPIIFFSLTQLVEPGTWPDLPLRFAFASRIHRKERDRKVGEEIPDQKFRPRRTLPGGDLFRREDVPEPFR